MTDTAIDATTDADAVDARPDPAPEPASTRARVHPWTDTAPHPWRRYFARSIDMTLFGLSAIFVLAGVLALVAADLMDPIVALLDGMAGQYLLAPVLTVGLSIPLMALSTSLTGGTPGKWLFGVRVTNAEGRRIGVGAALVREAKVAWFGLGMGLPLVSLFLGFQAKEQLEEKRATSWDEAGGFAVTHRRVNAWQIVLMIVGGALFAAIRIYGVVERFADMSS